MITAYRTSLLPAYEGTRASSAPMMANAALNKNGAEIPYGRGVVLAAIAASIGPNDYLPAKLPSAAGDKFLGVALHDHAHDPNNTNGILAGDMFSCIEQGDVYVKVEQAVTANDPVFVRHTANGAGTAPGQFRKDADTANAIAVTRARFLGSAAAGDVVGLRLNLP